MNLDPLGCIKLIDLEREKRESIDQSVVALTAAWAHEYNNKWRPGVVDVVRRLKGNEIREKGGEKKERICLEATEIVPLSGCPQVATEGQWQEQERKQKAIDPQSICTNFNKG